MQTLIRYWLIPTLYMISTLSYVECLRYSDVQECETSLLLDLYFNWNCARFKYPEILLVMEYQTDNLQVVFSYVKAKRNRDKGSSKEQRTTTPIDYNIVTVPSNGFLETRPYAQTRATAYRQPELIRFTPPTMEIQSFAARTESDQDYEEPAPSIIWRITGKGPKIKNDVIDILKSTEDRGEYRKSPNYRKQYTRPVKKPAPNHKKITPSVKKTERKSTTKIQELFENFRAPDSDKDEDIDDAERRPDEDIPVLRRTTLSTAYDDTDELFSKRDDYDDENNRLIQDNSEDNAKRYKNRKIKSTSPASRRAYNAFEGASNTEDFEELLARKHFISTTAPTKDDYGDYEDGAELERDYNVPKKMSTENSYREIPDESSTIGIHNIQEFDLEKYKVKPRHEEKYSDSDDRTRRWNKYHRIRKKRWIQESTFTNRPSDCTGPVCNIREKRFLPYYGGSGKNKAKFKDHHHPTNRTDPAQKHYDKNHKYSVNNGKSHDSYVKKHDEEHIRDDSDDEFKFGLEGKDEELMKIGKHNKYSLMNRLIPKVNRVLDNGTELEEVTEKELEDGFMEQQVTITTQPANDGNDMQDVNDAKVEMPSKQMNFTHADIRAYAFLAIYVFEPEKVYCDSIYLSKRWLVTSARCLVKHWGFSGRSISNIFTHKIVGQVRAYVVVCNDKWWMATKMFYVHQSIVHEDFMTKGSYNDVGLIKLEEDMENCGMSSLDLKKKWPAKLLKESPDNTIGAVSVGWGLYRFWSFAENSFVYKMNGLHSYNISLRALKCPSQSTRPYEVIAPKHVHENLCVMVDDILVEEIVSLTRFDPEIGGVLVSDGNPVAIASGVSYTSNGERFLSFTPVHAYRKWLRETTGNLSDDHDARNPAAKDRSKPRKHHKNDTESRVAEEPETQPTEQTLEVLTASVQRSENGAFILVLYNVNSIFSCLLHFSVTQYHLG